MDTEDNLEALFDAEDNDELLTELLNEHETEKTAKQKENDVDELALLNSFISDDEEEEGSKSVNAEDLKKMEDEYEELEKKMKALKDKMNTSGGEKCKADNTNKDNSPDESSIAPVEQKRSFFDAFGAGIDGAEIAEEKNEETPKPPDLKQKISVTGSEPLASEPSQKRRRICHNQSPENQPPSTSNSKVGSFTFYDKLKQAPVPKPKQIPKPFIGQQIFETEYFSRIRLKERFVSKEEMNERMKSKLYMKISLIRPTQKLCEEKDWVTIAVVAKQMDPQTAKNGKRFSIWHLSDLDDCTKHVALFLFGGVHEELWKKFTIGSVIGLLNPAIMPPRKDTAPGKSYDNTPALTVDVADRVMRIGVSADLGWCMATKFRNKKPAGKCLAFINKSIGETCIFHMQSKYKKMGSKRGELQGSVGAPIADKYKKTLWNKVKGDQFFYGGQVYSAAPPSTNHTLKKRESKMTLTKVFGTVASSAQTAQQKEAIEKSKIMQAISGIKEEQTITGCSDTFAAMLSSGDNIAGSRQFLNHLQRKKNEKIEKETEKPKTPASPAEFLRQQKQAMQERKKMVANELARPTNRTPSKQPTPVPRQFVSADEIRKCTEELIKAKRQAALNRKQAKQNGQNEADGQNPMSLSTATQALVGSKLPKLGGGLDKDIELNVEWPSKSYSSKSPTLAELRKRKAIAKLKSESGKVSIAAQNPNKISVKKSDRSKKLLEKVNDKVVLNRPELNKTKVNSKEGKENLNSEEQSSLLEAFGGSQMSKEEFEKILKARSTHTTELDIAEMEKQEQYFKPLVQKEMLQEKMAETYEVTSKVVTCEECAYTFWAPHERCKLQHHKLAWQTCKKKFFECTKCKQRTTTWEPYPTTACRGCGNQKTWGRCSMLRTKNNVKLDSEVLLLRGTEQPKFMNSVS